MNMHSPLKLTPIYLFSLLLFALAGCAAAPVQEMSDARQALQAADAVDASSIAPEPYSEALDKMQRAEVALAEGFFDQARVYAIEAKHTALQARKQALAGSNKYE